MNRKISQNRLKQNIKIYSKLLGYICYAYRGNPKFNRNWWGLAETDVLIVKFEVLHKITPSIIWAITTTINRGRISMTFDKMLKEPACWSVLCHGTVKESLYKVYRFCIHKHIYPSLKFMYTGLIVEYNHKFPQTGVTSWTFKNNWILWDTIWQIIIWRIQKLIETWILCNSYFSFS